jgi:YD repeat-containing protein
LPGGTTSPKPQAVSSAGAYSFTYDCDGNVITRTVGSTYGLSYDTESHLTGISGAATATFVYDGDGNRVEATIGAATTAYLGNYYEWNGSAGVTHYYASRQRVAMRDAGGALYFLLSDNLGSTSKVATASGAFYGGIRTSSNLLRMCTGHLQRRRYSRQPV